jgi:hypothetical protein
VFSEGLKITGFPAMNAPRNGAITWLNGKFQGAMTSTGPIGSNTTLPFLPISRIGVFSGLSASAFSAVLS